MIYNILLGFSYVVIVAVMCFFVAVIILLMYDMGWISLIVPAIIGSCIMISCDPGFQNFEKKYFIGEDKDE